MHIYIIYLKVWIEQFHVYPCIVQQAELDMGFRKELISNAWLFRESNYTVIWLHCYTVISNEWLSPNTDSEIHALLSNKQYLTFHGMFFFSKTF